MEDVKYIQRKETRYANNEFANMPSIDFQCNGDDIANNKDKVDWIKVGEICKRYGFRYCILNSYGRSEFLVYLLTDISVEHYDKLRKAYNNSYEDRKRYWALGDSYEWAFRKLHECVHELDEQTNLLFECGWSGNSGLFGSNDVKVQSYSFGSSLYSWNYIIDHWSPILYDTKSKLSKGIYVMISTEYIKAEIVDSPPLEELEPKFLEIARDVCGNEYVADFEIGKRQCDKCSYRALVIRYKETNEYCGMLRFSRDWCGHYEINYACPLGGESSLEIDWTNPYKSIRNAIGYFIN